MDLSRRSSRLGEASGAAWVRAKADGRLSPSLHHDATSRFTLEPSGVPCHSSRMVRLFMLILTQ